MNDPIRVFVASDWCQHEAGAEDVIEQSIRETTPGPVEITYMRAGPPDHPHTSPGFAVSPDGAGDTWNIGRPIHLAWPRVGWATPFSCFRMAVPEHAGFTGKAIYMDADMIICADLRELWEMSQVAPWKCISHKRTDVSLIQCEPFKDLKGWPRIAKMKQSRAPLWKYRAFLQKMNMIDTGLSEYWDHCDVYEPGKTKVCHMTRVPSQPYHPYSSVRYEKHKDQRVVDHWFEVYERAMVHKYGEAEGKARAGQHHALV